MKITNILSMLGVVVASFFAYGYFYLGATGPGYYPVAVTLLVLGVFCVSYLLSLFDAHATSSKICALSFVFLGFVSSTMFSILVMLGKSTYPSIFGISGAYLEAVLFLLLLIQWNRHR
jgi:hypothetical protein